MAAQGLAEGSYTASVIAGGLSTTGGFEFTLQRPQVSTVGSSRVSPGSITETAPVGVHRFVVSPPLGPIIVRVSPAMGLTASVGVLGPDGSFASSGVGSNDRPAAIPLPTPEDGSYLMTVTGLDGSVGDYEVFVESSLAPWDFAALVPAFAGNLGLGVSDYSINFGGTSVNCVDWARNELVEEEAVKLNPLDFDDHSTWAWAARFNSLTGVRSYLASFGSGCDFVSDVDERRFIFAPSDLNEEALWYVTAVEDGGGVINLESVGVITTTDRTVVEVQVFVRGNDGSFSESVPIDPDHPYSNDIARRIAEEMVGEATRVRLEMTSG